MSTVSSSMNMTSQCSYQKELRELFFGFPSRGHTKPIVFAKDFNHAA